MFPPESEAAATTGEPQAGVGSPGAAWMPTRVTLPLAGIDVEILLRNGRQRRAYLVPLGSWMRRPCEAWDGFPTFLWHPGGIHPEAVLAWRSGLIVS